jgi:hypothetical protein
MTVSLGAYILGAVDAGERQELSRHVPGCEPCRDELVNLAPLPGLLRRVPERDVLRSGDDDPFDAADLDLDVELALEDDPQLWGNPASGDRMPDLSEGAAARRQARLPVRLPARLSGRRRVVLAALVSCLLAAATAVVILVSRPDTATQGPGGAPVIISAADPTARIHATATLTPQGWGTDIRMRLAGLPSGLHCRLVVHGRDGRTEFGGTWNASYAESIAVWSATAISVADISSLDVLAGDRLLIRVRGMDA